eukprot:358862_1
MMDKAETGLFGLCDDTEECPHIFMQLDGSQAPSYPIYKEDPFFEGDAKGRQFFFINGQIRPGIPMKTSKWYHLRIVDTVMNYLLFYIKNDETYNNCRFMVMGRDG